VNGTSSFGEQSSQRRAGRTQLCAQVTLGEDCHPEPASDDGTASAPRRQAIFLACSLALALWACKTPPSEQNGRKDESPKGAFSLGATPAKPDSQQDARDEVLLNWLELPAECTLEHQGTLLDFGDVTAPHARVRGSRDVRVEALRVEHEGATWLRISGRELSSTFHARQATVLGEALAVHTRAKGGVARSMSLNLNGHPIGLAGLSKGKVTLASFKVTTAAVLAGDNELSIRFNGPSKTGDVVSELDWVHIGPFDDDTPYAAPTRGDAVGTVTIGPTPRRALSLRGPGSALCIMHLHGQTKFRAQLAVLGKGEADLEVRVHRDRLPTFVAGSLHLSDEREWRPVELDLGNETGLAQVELAVVRAPKGVRVAFAEAKVVALGTPAIATRETPQAKSAIIILMGSTPPHAVSVYGGTNEVPELGSLAASGVVFEAHRSSGSVAAGTLASILTGIDANEHRVSDGVSRLPSGLTTIVDCAREGGLLTALFTANPGTSAAFGMHRGFSTYGYSDPTDPEPATKVFDDAAEWISRHRDGRFLLVIHARGGHPPWDASAAKLKEMPPLNYTGGIDPKHAGEFLARVRTTRGAHFTDMDRARLWALYNLAVTSDDAALGRLLDALRSLHREEDTALIVTSDVGLDTLRVPFGEHESLSEDLLASVLVMRPPTKTAFVSERRRVPSTPADLAVTVLASLGLKPPATFHGKNLWAEGAEPSQPRARMAWLGRRYALKMGAFVLTGGDGNMHLCETTIDPTCATDVRATYPIAFARLLSAAEQKHQEAVPVDREIAAIDVATSNALHLWGRTLSR
jgi:Sulfatase